MQGLTTQLHLLAVVELSITLLLNCWSPISHFCLSTWLLCQIQYYQLKYMFNGQISTLLVTIPRAITPLIFICISVMHLLEHLFDWQMSQSTIVNSLVCSSHLSSTKTPLLRPNQAQMQPVAEVTDASPAVTGTIMNTVCQRIPINILPRLYCNATLFVNWLTLANVSACMCMQLYRCVRLCVSVYLFTSVCSSVSCSTRGSVGYQCNWITSLSSCPGVCW